MVSEHILSLFSKEEIQFVKIGIIDLDGIVRGKVIHKEKALDILTMGTGFCDVVFGWDSQDKLYENESITGWTHGYPDKNYKLDPNSLRQLSWQNGMPFLLGDFESTLPDYCPRTLLKKQESLANNMGFEPLFSFEYEWFNFRKEGQALSTISTGMFGYSLLRLSESHSFIHQLLDNLESAEIKLEGLHTETGPGVLEACIKPASPLHAADQAALFKAFTKEIASSHSIKASFMAKWNEKLPGCSGHLHQSLWQNGKNLFYSGDPKKITEIQRHFIAGQLYALPHLMPMYAPTINSYKRLVKGAWAPTTVSWGWDNRTTAIRVLPLHSKTSRVEFRVAGADANPYLVLAAALASGLYGIQNKLELEDAVKGNAYAVDNLAQLPGSLGRAVKQMEESTLAKELFGEHFINHFAMTRRWEADQFDKSVTDWEIQRYLEII